MPRPRVAGQGQRQGAVLKGFFSGLLWGAVLGAIVFVIVSEMTLMPAEGAKAPSPAPQAEPSEPTGAAAPVSEKPQTVAEAPADVAVMPEAEPSAATAPEAVQVPAGSEVNRSLPDQATTPPGTAPEPAASLSPQVGAPSQGGSLPETNAGPEGAPAPALIAPEAAAAPDTAQDPINRYARDFSNPQGKPVFAIVLIDRGDPGLDRAALAALPFPVTFVLDPTLPDVARLADAYIAAGQEVAMLATAIPEGATAADLEVTFGAHAAALPQAVAVVDLAEGGFQGNRPLATQVIPIIQGQGRGLLTYDAGLNAADQVARRDQLRAGTIFRRIDPEGRPPGEIRRVLDRAAFKAAQDGRVAVVGEATPATVAALLEWTVEGRAAAMALAPATAVMVAR